MSESFDLGEPPAPPPASGQAYRVLARKYRPQRFSELIGQDAMVTTLGNAIKRDRIAHAFLMTGVRGVGKTSTARLIAKALNCIGPDGQGAPTIDPCGVCEPCIAIAEGRFIDVLEMDAASNTKVEQMRELLDNVPYASTSARYKIYIIDEVHMLSNSSFNALLKTLEEPPPHVKFLFATTEVNKVPVTVLSRCQRFDLRRISAEMLAAHFARIVEAEQVKAEDEALTLIARAAEGSVRDGLSILDQAIAHADLDGDGMVSAAQVRDMLGLSDRGAVRRLFGLLIGGDSVAAITALREQRDLGVEPLAVLRGLLEVSHGATLVKVGAPADPSQSVEERAALDRWADGLSFPLLHRLWQMLLKGQEEVARAGNPHEAAEMALLRVIHASQLPDPADLIRKLESGTTFASTAPAAAPPANPIPHDFQAMIAAIEAAGKHRIGVQLRDEVGLIRYEPPTLAIRPTRPFDVRELVQTLKDLTGVTWDVSTEDQAAAPTLREQEASAAANERTGVLAQPLVAAAFETFPDAELIGYEISPTRSANA